jgi:uncharacterized protein YndB with AHSA1/START domain
VPVDENSPRHFLAPGTHETRKYSPIRTHFASVADRDAFMKTGVTDGWSQSLERLETLLAKA